MYTLNLNPILDVFILMVATRAFLEPEGKLFFTWTLALWERITEPALWLPAALRWPGWRNNPSLHAAILLVLLRALALLAIDLAAGGSSPLPLWVGTGHFALNALPFHLSPLLFSFLSVFTTALVLVGAVFLIHHSVPLDYRHTPTGLLLAGIMRRCNRASPRLRIVLWILSFYALTCGLLLCSGRWITPPGPPPEAGNIPLMALLLTLETVRDFITTFQLMLCTALLLSALRIHHNAFVDLVESLSEALCAPLRALDLSHRNVDWTYPVALLTLTFLKTGLSPLLRLLEQAVRLMNP